MTQSRSDDKIKYDIFNVNTCINIKLDFIALYDDIYPAKKWKTIDCLENITLAIQNSCLVASQKYHG